MSMAIHTGSKNPIKINAVNEALSSAGYQFTNIGFECESGVADQPLTLDETYRGAKNRANSCWQDGVDLAIGLEDGIYHIEESELYMNINVCVIFDGINYYYGTSSSFRYPDDVMDAVLNRGMDVSQALNFCAYTDDANIGSDQGAIGIFSSGKMGRLQYTLQSINAALVHYKPIC